MQSPLSQKLYLRIWLAVVGMLVFVMVVSALGWRAYMDHERAEALVNPGVPPSRVMFIRDADGNLLAIGSSTPTRRPGLGLEFNVKMPDGRELAIQLPPRQRPGAVPGEEGGRIRPPFANGPQQPGVFDWRWLPTWMRPPYSFVWFILILSIAIAIGAYPVARRLTQRLEQLRDGVRKFGEGDLSARVEVKGKDEVGYLADQFNASAQRVQQLVEAQKSLLANASHELRSPLARIRMGMEMLAPGTGLDPIRAKTRSEMQRSIQELDELIEEILLSSKLDAFSSGKQVDLGTQENVDLIGLCAEECARVGAEFHLEEGRTSCSVVGHARLLTRLVRNLLENAKRYTKGEIDLSMQIVNQGKQVELRICDHGPGVPVALRARIFEPFYRLPGASERDGGVGLGLALVNSIALKHQGTVVCEDRPDGAKGACFTVTLPYAG